MIEGQTIFSSNAGTAKVEGVTFTGAPGSTFKIDFSGDGIDETKPTNKQYKDSIVNTTGTTTTSSSGISYELTVVLRDCEVGE